MYYYLRTLQLHNFHIRPQVNVMLIFTFQDKGNIYY